MSIKYYTSQDVSDAISNAEQLSLALVTISGSSTEINATSSALHTLLLKLHDDLERLSVIHMCAVEGIKVSSK